MQFNMIKLLLNYIEYNRLCLLKYDGFILQVVLNVSRQLYCLANLAVDFFKHSTTCAPK